MHGVRPLKSLGLANLLFWLSTGGERTGKRRHDKYSRNALAVSETYCSA